MSFRPDIEDWLEESSGLDVGEQLKLVDRMLGIYGESASFSAEFLKKKEELEAVLMKRYLLNSW